jgi:hypothetical protein
VSKALLSALRHKVFASSVEKAAPSVDEQLSRHLSTVFLLFSFLDILRFSAAVVVCVLQVPRWGRC